LLFKPGESFAPVACVSAHGRFVELYALARKILPGEHEAAPVEALGGIFMVCCGFFRVFLWDFFDACGRNGVEGGASGKFLRQRLVDGIVSPTGR
jgi:hypothetical protein